MADDTGWGGVSGSGDNIGGGIGSSSLGGGGWGTAALGVGALGLGSILSMGESPLPAQFGQLQASVPGLRDEAHALELTGSHLTGEGEQALAMAARGELTPEQQAQLKVYSGGLENTSRQMFANMGRNPDADTAAITQQGNIDTQVNAMAQAQIQSTIALGLGEISAGQGATGQARGFESAANQALIAAGNAQIQLDKQYSDALTGAFSAIGNLFGAMGKAAMAGA
jgi:hypothetical protein